MSEQPRYLEGQTLCFSEMSLKDPDGREIVRISATIPASVLIAVDAADHPVLPLVARLADAWDALPAGSVVAFDARVGVLVDQLVAAYRGRTP